MQRLWQNNRTVGTKRQSGRQEVRILRQQETNQTNVGVFSISQRRAVKKSVSAVAMTLALILKGN
jgi:hypothetical protein